MEWVQNASDRPIPEPNAFTPDEKRLMFDLQRRSHLVDWDDKYKRAPLTAVERTMLNDFETRQRLAGLLRFGGIEFRFAPGEIIEVRDGVASQLIPRLPDKLRRLTWHDVRDLEVAPRLVHVESQEENRALLIEVSTGDDDSVNPHAPTTIEVKDGMVRHGDGKWQPLVEA